MVSVQVTWALFWCPWPSWYSTRTRGQPTDSRLSLNGNGSKVRFKYCHSLVKAWFFLGVFFLGGGGGVLTYLFRYFIKDNPHLGGHPFWSRHGALYNNNNNNSSISNGSCKETEVGPVFLLFLDATFQIYSQFPCSFEFTHKILGTNMHQNVSNIFVNWSDRDMGNPVERHGLLHSDAGSDKKKDKYS